MQTVMDLRWYLHLVTVLDEHLQNYMVLIMHLLHLLPAKVFMVHEDVIPEAVEVFLIIKQMLL